MPLRFRPAPAAGAALLLALLAGRRAALQPPGAAAQAPPPLEPQELPAAPEAATAASGRAKRLPKCALVDVAGPFLLPGGKKGSCAVKKDGKVFLVKDASITVYPDGEEEAFELGAQAFSKQFARTYPGAGPGAGVEYTSDFGVDPTPAAVEDVRFKKQKSGLTKLRFKVAKADRAGLAALGPSSFDYGCSVLFRTPCNPSPSECSYGDTQCAAGAVCPVGTAVSAECADRSAFTESPCACTALQQLAGMSEKLKAEAPWNALAESSYCSGSNQDDGTLQVEVSACRGVGSGRRLGALTWNTRKCRLVGGVNMPIYVDSTSTGLTGAMPSSVGDLGALVNYLSFQDNSVSSLPTEIGALQGLLRLEMDDNELTSLPSEIAKLGKLFTLTLRGNKLTTVPTEIAAMEKLSMFWISENNIPGLPTEFRTFNASDCYLAPQDLSAGAFSCSNVGVNTSCCTADGDILMAGNKCGEGQPGGPCFGA